MLFNKCLICFSELVPQIYGKIFHCSNEQDHYLLSFNPDSTFEFEQFKIDNYYINNFIVLNKNYCLIWHSGKKIIIDNIRIIPSLNLNKIKTYIIFS